MQVVCSGKSSFSDEVRGGPGHPDPEIRGGPVSKKFFQPFRPQFGLKNKPPSPPLDPPLVCVESILMLFLCHSSFGRKSAHEAEDLLVSLRQILCQDFVALILLVCF